MLIAANVVPPPRAIGKRVKAAGLIPHLRTMPAFRGNMSLCGIAVCSH